MIPAFFKKYNLPKNVLGKNKLLINSNISGKFQRGVSPPSQSMRPQSPNMKSRQRCNKGSKLQADITKHIGKLGYRNFPATSSKQNPKTY